MSRHRKAIPSYLHHKPTGEARMGIYVNGKRRIISLGKFGSAESKKRYRELLKELEVKETKKVAETAKSPATRKPATVAGLCLQFLDHAREYYRRADGTNTSEYDHYGCAVEVLTDREEIADMRADDFGRAELGQVREAMLAKGWTRQHINQQVRRVKSVFRWAEEREYVSEGKWGSLQILGGLKAGRTPGVPEQREILPVSDVHIEATLPFLTPTVIRMVRFHRLTACRPQDVCALEWERIDRTEKVWVFSPDQHKGAHRGQSRTVRIGPAAQAILGPPGTGFVFSPRDSFSEVLEKRMAARKSSAVRRNVEAKRVLLPRRRPKERFTTQSYIRAITRACEKAKIKPHWTPNQLRHAALAEYRDRFGLDVAQVIAGHRHSKTTEIYASPSEEAARKATEAMG